MPSNDNVPSCGSATSTPDPPAGEGCPPIAIVGMGMRLPGGVRCADEFWQMMVEKRDGHCEVPGTRYNIDGFYNSTGARTIKTRHGYFLQEDPTLFDADFFSITDIEAERIDPQQRLLLEVVWECLESAGETDWRGKRIGCYVGTFGEDWSEHAVKDASDVDKYHAVATGHFALANRISYQFDLRGPSVTVLTACSSALVGLNEACQAIYAGDCSGAIVAGSSLILSPTMTTTMSVNGVISPDGLSKSFDKSANGYGRGEAINAIYIKPLRDALDNNDPIHAVIRATATNCDGKTPSITAPGTDSQRDLIYHTYRKAGIEDLTRTAFLECHGTGTRIGDVFELSVVADIFKEKGIHIGSVKPNVGHGEAASGITSVIKAALMLSRKKLLPNTHLNTPNPRISWKEGKLQVALEPTPWPIDRAERVSVSAFGIGGSNAHAILDAYEGRREEPALVPDDLDPQLLIISAAGNEALKGRILSLTQYVNTHPGRLHDLAYTLSHRRTHLPHRAFAIAYPNRPLDATAFQSSHSKPRQIIYAFTGQGAQWPGMGRELIEAYPSFARDIHDMDALLKRIDPSLPWSLADQLSNPEGASGQAEISQPACTALQIALVNLLRTWGMNPFATIGHSSGEVAAAYAAGAITLQSAILISFFRGRVLRAQDSKGGGMAVIAMSPTKIAAYLCQVQDVEIACENAPDNVTVSGDRAEVDKLLQLIRASEPNVFSRVLPVNVAYHSRQMKDLGAEYEELMAAHHERATPTKCHMFSSVTGLLIKDFTTLDPSYWRQNLEMPVRFNSAVQSILSHDSTPKAFLEIGPHSSLSALLRQIFASHQGKNSPVYIPTVIRHSDIHAREQLLMTMGRVYANNVPISRSAMAPPGTVLTDLPLYPWDHSRAYRHESRIGKAWRTREAPSHEILGTRVWESPDTEPLWRNMLRSEEVDWIKDHRIQGDTIFPAAGYIAMVGEAVSQLGPSPCDYSVRNLALKEALVIPDAEKVEIITSLRQLRLNDAQDSEAWYSFTIISRGPDTWVKHCQGEVRAGSDCAPEWKEIPTYPRVVPAHSWYRTLADHGLDYGPSFRGLTDISADPVDYQAAATVTDRPEPSSGSRYLLHPVVIDQCLQSMSVAASNGSTRRLDRSAIPAAIKGLYIGSAGPRMKLACKTRALASGIISGDVTLVQGDKVVLSMSQGTLFAAQAPQERPLLVADVRWEPYLELLPLGDLVGLAVNHSEYAGSMDMVERITMLGILEIDKEVKDMVPKRPHLAKWKSWIHKKAEECRSGEYTVLPDASVWAMWDARAVQELRAQYMRVLDDEPPESSPSTVASTVAHIVDRYIDILDGEADALELMVKDDTLRGIYEYAVKYTDWARVFALLSHWKPSMRVIEIGGGTGSATRQVLKHLSTKEGVPLYDRYTFTDLSPAFVSAMRDSLIDQNRMEYKTLDITRNPIEQDVEAETYDLVVASNVLHATPSLHSSLRNIRTLLKPGGYLLLHELHPETCAMDLVMGLLPGWWAGEKDDRVEAPYVSPERWATELQAAGFTGSEAIAYDTTPPYHQNFTMISRAVREDASRRDPVTLVGLDRHHVWANGLFSSLEADGYFVSWGGLHDSPPTDQDIFLLADLESPTLYDMTAQEFKALQIYLANLGNSRLIWITPGAQLTCNDPRFGLTAGFVRTIRAELELNIVTVEVDDIGNPSTLDAIRGIYTDLQRAPREQTLASSDYEFAIKDGTVHIARCHWTASSEALGAETPHGDGRALKLTGSLLGTAEWASYPSSNLEAGEVEVDIKYVALNFRDIMAGMGLVGSQEEMGCEATGVIRRTATEVTEFRPGDRVVVMHSGLYRTRVALHQRCCRRIPDHLSLDEAVTMPVVYATVVYSLLHLSQLQKGQSVLIHSACGGVGLAAIHICRMVGAEIFCSVGGADKVTYLMEVYGIPRRRIFDSRSHSFLPGVLRETNGRGVDIVLNSLSGELLHASWKCVAPFGRMIELGKRDLLTNGTLPMNPFAENRAFFAVDLLKIAEEHHERFKEIFDQAFTWCEQGKIPPIRPTTVFDAADIMDALRYMQTGTHMGKILIRMPEDPMQLPGRNLTTPASFSGRKSYLLIGGLGGVGRAISTWMVENGARDLVYLSRSAGDSPDDQLFVQELRVQGCTVKCVRGSVARSEDVNNAISSCRQPLGGLIQLSLALSDQSFAKMSYEEWSTALEAKTRGTWNLHEATKDMDLDFFVLFSSLSGSVGMPGQANYAAANTFLDSFHLYRQGAGLPSTVIDLGVVRDIGRFSRGVESWQGVQTGRIHTLTESDVIQGLQLALSRTMGASPVIIGLEHEKTTGDASFPDWVENNPRISAYGAYMRGHASSAAEPSTANMLKTLLAEVTSNPTLLNDEQTRLEVRTKLLMASATHLPRGEDMDEEEIANTPIDSLMAIEMRMWARRHTDIELSVIEITKAGTFGHFADRILDRALQNQAGDSGRDHPTTGVE